MCIILLSCLNLSTNNWSPSNTFIQAATVVLAPAFQKSLHLQRRVLRRFLAKYLIWNQSSTGTINMNPPITSNFKKHKHIVKSKSMVFFLDIYIYYLILWLFFWRLFVSIIHGSQPLDQRNHSPSAASTSTAQWARPRARALRYLRCTRCLSQKKTDITFLVAFFIFF